ncbi:MAG: hypothetical protein ACE5J9_03485, partial [Methanosarcinales archaeon]
MINIKASQHIYSNVEKEKSPRGKGGFQTLFYTKDTLTEEEVEEIERRLLYYPSEAEPIKYLFFSLNEEKFVISRIVSLPETDKFGRKGRYFAHSFIFSKEEFFNAKNNPFILFDLFRENFTNTVEEVSEIAKFKEQDIDAITIETNQEIIEKLEIEGANSAQNWDIEELKKLAYFALHPEVLAKDRNCLTLFGTPENIKNTLKIAFFLIPPYFRLKCSFDTYFYGCNLVANYFWAIGFTSKSDIPSYQAIILDAKEKKLYSEKTPTPTSPYEKWLFNSISKKAFSDLGKYHSIALNLQYFLINQKYKEELLKDISPPFLHHFFQLNWSEVTKKTEKVLKDALGTYLSSRIINSILDDYKQKPEKLLHSLRYGFDSNYLADTLYTAFKEDLKTKPSNEELKELEAFLKKNEHPFLKIFYFLWNQNYKELNRQLEILQKEEYKDLVALILKEELVPIKNLISESKIDQFLEVFIELAQKYSTLKKYITDVIRNLRAYSQ